MTERYIGSVLNVPYEDSRPWIKDTRNRYSVRTERFRQPIGAILLTHTWSTPTTRFFGPSFFGPGRRLRNGFLEMRSDSGEMTEERYYNTDC